MIPAGYEPLDRVVYADDFDRGAQGWTLLTGNYERSLDSLIAEQRDFRPPMLSSLTMWDTGTAGSLHGTYALKLATRPHPGSISVALKRTTFRRPCPIQVEAYFAVKPEATDLVLGDRDVRAFGIFLDLQDGRERVMPHLRYHNAEAGERRHRWLFKKDRPPVKTISGETRSHFHLGPDGWLDVPGGEQDLCYNELPTKQNWHYLNVGFDLRSMTYTHLHCNNRTFEVTDVSPMRMPAWPNLDQMLNVGFWVETDTAVRAFLYLDSVVVSAGTPS